jgi:hypothetical protein
MSSQEFFHLRWKVALVLPDFVKIEKRTEREVEINNLSLFAHSDFGCFRRLLVYYGNTGCGVF